MLCLHISRFASAFLDRAKPVSEMEGSGIELHGGLPEGETPRARFQAEPRRIYTNNSKRNGDNHE